MPHFLARRLPPSLSSPLLTRLQSVKHMGAEEEQLQWEIEAGKRAGEAVLQGDNPDGIEAGESHITPLPTPEHPTAALSAAELVNSDIVAAPRVVTVAAAGGGGTGGAAPVAAMAPAGGMGTRAAAPSAPARAPLAAASSKAFRPRGRAMAMPSDAVAYAAPPNAPLLAIATPAPVVAAAAPMAAAAEATAPPLRRRKGLRELLPSFFGRFFGLQGEAGPDDKSVAQAPAAAALAATATPSGSGADAASDLAAAGMASAGQGTPSSLSEDSDNADSSWGHQLMRLLLLKEPIAVALYRTRISHDMGFLRGIASFIAFGIHGLLALTLAGSLGLDIRPLVTGIGLSGFAVGFAVKEIFANMLSGALLVVQRPFRVGWKIRVAGAEGRVHDIDSRYVYLSGDGGKTITLIPSYKVYSSDIVVLDRSAPPPPPLPKPHVKNHLDKSHHSFPHLFR
ncbi:unnamed protein product [Phaeothamnion confervicola]